MKKTLSLILAAAILLGSLVMTAAASADGMYIITDSDTRELTRDELWEYQYDTLLYAFNEIYARHGYKFETGSRCYNWFTQMPWYVPNENENSKELGLGKLPQLLCCQRSKKDKRSVSLDSGKR